MSIWADNKIVELLARVEALEASEARRAAMEREHADEKKPDRALESRRANAR